MKKIPLGDGLEARVVSQAGVLIKADAGHEIFLTKEAFENLKKLMEQETW